MMDSVKTAQFAGFKGSCSIDEAIEFIMEQLQMGNRVKLFPKEEYKKMQWVYVHSNVAGSGRTLHGALIPETLMLTSLVACPENTPWTSSIYTCPKHKTKKKVYERFPFAIIGIGGWVHPGQASIWKWPRVVNPTKWGFNGIGQMSLLRVTFQLT